MTYIDILKNSKKNDLDKIFNDGVGKPINLENPFLLISQHPVTTEYGHGEYEITQTLLAAKMTNIPSIILWPNADAGAEDISRGIRKFREKYSDIDFYYFKNLEIEQYIKLMKTIVL